MNWLKDQWNRLPEKLRAYALKVLAWLALVAVGYVVRYLTGQEIERVPFPVYVEREVVYTQPGPTNGDTHSQGWVPPTPEEQAAALATIKANQNGLDPDFSKLAKAAIEAADADDPVFFWEAETKVLKRLLPVWNQGSIGSCVSHGVGRACQDVIISQIASGAAEEWPGAEVAREPIYGGSRVEIGGGQIRGDGSINAWAVAWLQKYGVVFYKSYPGFDLTGGYSVSRCREYGQRGCPDGLEPLAREHPVKTAALVKSSAEIWTAIGNGYPVCIASNVGFQSPLREGFCERRGSWAHSMCVRGRFVHPSKGKCFVIQNSWGDYLSGGDPMLAVVGRPDKIQLPPGCFACTSNDMDVVARQSDSFALSGFNGFKRRQIDWSVRREQQEDQMRVALALVLMASPVFAEPQQPTQLEMEAQAALELQLALQKNAPVVTAHKAERLTYADAVAKALKEGKPLLTRVNDFKCQSACESCKDAILTDAPQCWNDATPRLILSYPSQGKLWFDREWRTVPTATTVQSAVGKVSTCAGCPKGKCEDCNGTCNGPNCQAAKSVPKFYQECTSGR